MDYDKLLNNSNRLCSNLECKKILKTSQHFYCSHSCRARCRIVSTETKIKISNYVKSRWENDTKFKNAALSALLNCDKHHTDETKQKIRLKAIGRHHTQESRNKIGIASMINIAKNSNRYTSKPEKEFLEKIENIYQLKFDKAFKLFDGNTIKIYDARYGNNLLELDGTYWHSRKEVQQNDLIKDKLAQTSGYRLFRVKNYDSYRSIDESIQKNKKIIEEFLRIN